MTETEKNTLRNAGSIPYIDGEDVDGIDAVDEEGERSEMEQNGTDEVTEKSVKMDEKCEKGSHGKKKKLSKSSRGISVAHTKQLFYQESLPSEDELDPNEFVNVSASLFCVCHSDTLFCVTNSECCCSANCSK